jgi:hypothetical protein
MKNRKKFVLAEQVENKLVTKNKKALIRGPSYLTINVFYSSCRYLPECPRYKGNSERALDTI